MILILANAVNILLETLELLILADAILSWVRINENSITYAIHSITEPILSPCRRIQYMVLPRLPVDFSPIIALFALRIIATFIYKILYILSGIL